MEPAESVTPSLTGAKRKAAPSVIDSEKRRRYYDADVIDNLSIQVSQIQNFLQTLSHQNDLPQAIDHDYDDALSLNASGELFEEDLEHVTQQNNEHDSQQTTLHELQPSLQNEIPSNNPLPGFSLEVNTTLKEPSMLKTDSVRLERLKTIQHFNSQDWSEVRYSEAQKRFCSTPGFTNLECNDEIKPYDKYNHLAVTEKGFAAITQGLLKQQESVESGIRELISWLRSSDIVEMSVVENKIKNIFSGDFQKISNDLLQMACGHRADLIEQRRDTILRSVKDKFIKASLRKIPPSCEFLFSPQDFASTVDKNGGMNRIFWSQKTQTMKSAAQSLALKNNRQPAQGFTDITLPNTLQNVTRTAMPAHGIPLNPFTPAQGGFQYPLVGTNFAPRTLTQGNPFRPRGPRPNQETAQRQTKSGPFRRGMGRRKY